VDGEAGLYVDRRSGRGVDVGLRGLDPADLLDRSPFVSNQVVTRPLSRPESVAVKSPQSKLPRTDH
jgi:hypothetical protein